MRKNVILVIIITLMPIMIIISTIKSVKPNAPITEEFTSIAINTRVKQRKLKESPTFYPCTVFRQPRPLLEGALSCR